ncbi:MAG: alpha/beta hydrolase [Candidatus Omnitrophica bacterium]|nr:alpha/beta hydrolase [Candidatus Omnitrophota bacterium]
MSSERTKACLPDRQGRRDERTIRGTRGILAAIFITLLLSHPACLLAGEITEGEVLTEDNVSIAYSHYKNGFKNVVIVCPGFYNSKKNRWMKKTVKMLSSEYDVIIFDFRGHGESSGKFTWAALEDRDVNAIVDYAKRDGYEKIGILGFSLGGSSAINAASKRERDITTMVLISTPTSFKAIDFHFWELGMFDDLFDNISCGWEGKGAKTTNKFKPEITPIESIKKIKSTPMLFIHGKNDWVVKRKHSEELFAAANEPKKLVIIKKDAHAERLIQKRYEEMRELILGWFGDTMRGDGVPKGRKDERTRGREDERTRGREDERTKGREDDKE